MDKRKISLDIDGEAYVKLKLEALNNRVTVSNIIRGLLQDKYEGNNE